jgi:hypothetical protein
MHCAFWRCFCFCFSLCDLIKFMHSFPQSLLLGDDFVPGIFLWKGHSPCLPDDYVLEGKVLCEWASRPTMSGYDGSSEHRHWEGTDACKGEGGPLSAGGKRGAGWSGGPREGWEWEKCHDPIIVTEALIYQITVSLYFAQRLLCQNK